MRISVAMATYNGAKYLAEQLESFMIQTKQPDELVVSDDNSTDNTFEILEKFKSSAPFEVILLKNEGESGYNKNFENALKNTEGDIIYISDQDDVWYKNKIEFMNEYIVKEKCLLAIHDLEYCSSDMKPLGQTKIERFKSFRKSLDYYVTGMATAIRGEFLKSCLPIPNGVNYDNWLHACARILKERNICDKRLAQYRRHDENATIGSILNSSTKTNYLHYISNRINNNSIKEIHDQKLIVECLIKYLEDNEEMIYNIYDYKEYKINLLDVKKKKEYLNCRVNILNLSFFNRILKILKLYMKSDIRHHYDFKSVMKDLFINYK